MSRPARQFADAVAEHITKRDYGMPGDDAASDAVAAIADRDIANWNVGELYEVLYGEGQVAGALDRLMCGTRAQFGDERVLQNLRRRLLALESEVEREMAS